jgi:hypothetical protein
MSMTNEEVKERLANAIRTFRERDGSLLRRNLSERCVTHKLAEHIAVQFPEYDVDCEYNRNIDDSKNIEVDEDDLTKALREKYAERIADLSADEVLSLSTFPDIIVHRREQNFPHNILVLEIKKDNCKIPHDLDRLKLARFIDPQSYGYQLGAFITVPTGNAWENEFDFDWIEGRNDCRGGGT